MEVHNKMYFVVFLLTFANLITFAQDYSDGKAHPIFVIISIVIFLATALITTGGKDEAIRDAGDSTQ